MNTDRTRVAAYALAGLLAAASGCATAGPATETSMQNLRNKASFDMNCPAAELSIVHLSGQCGTTSYNMCMQGVTGCGQRASYLYLTAGSWTLESSSKPESEAKE